MEIQFKQRQQIMVISLTGSFDALTADPVWSAIGRQLDKGHRQVILDMSGVHFMSSSGVRVLLETLKAARETGGDLRLAGAQLGVQGTLEISGMVRILKTYASLEEAMDSFGHSEA